MGSIDSVLWKRLGISENGHDHQAGAAIVASENTTLSGSVCIVLLYDVDGFVEVVTQSIWCNDEEHLQLLTVPLIYAPIANPHSSRFKLLFECVNVRYKDCCSVLRGVAAIDCKPNTGSVAFKDHGWHRLPVTCDLGHSEVFTVPVRCPVQVCDGQRQNIVLIRKCSFESWLV
jgi:hypothetical protein